MSKYFLLALLTILSFQVSAQTKITIQEGVSLEAMPFVKVIPNSGNPGFTDIDGRFLIPQDATEFKLRFMGYKDSLYILSALTSDTIFMWSAVQDVSEVTAVAGENPAHRIMNLVIKNRKDNHPLANDAFTYKSYSKFIFDADDGLKDRLVKAPEGDSSLNDLQFLNKQHLFMLESATERKFIPPAKDREDITAYKISGLTLPIFSTFAQSLQSFNFYDNEFELVGSTYINPIASGGTERYLFILQDTTVVGNDTTFTISYRPRINKNFKGMEGTMYINTNGYAIEKVIASPYSRDTTSSFTAKIVQEYQFIDGKKWFPTNLSTQVELKGLSLNSSGGYVTGIGHTYIKDIVINPEDLKKRGFGNISIATDEDAGITNDKVWEEYRVDPLTDKEKRTYYVVDSVAKEGNFDRKLAALMALTTGKIRLNKISLVLDRIVDYNIYEGVRFGAGLETSDRLMKNITIGGYFGWATRDKEWKYGGYSIFDINKRNGLQVTLSYQQDLLHRGGNVFTKKGFNLGNTEAYARLYRTFMDRQRIAELKVGYEPLGNLKLFVSGNYQRVEFTKGYQFLPADTAYFFGTKVDLAETSLEMQWNIRERVMLIGDMRMPEPSGYPKIALKITKGWKGIADSQMDYIRLNLKISQDVRSLRFGELNWTLLASQSFGEVPLSLKQNAVGTRQDWNISTANTFETVYPGEFYHDRQAALFLRYGFPTIKTKAKWNEPQFILHHGIGVGDFKNKLEHSQTFGSMDNGMFEAGLILNGMLTQNMISIGVGAFYRYGFYANTNELKNIVPKISLKMGLPL